VAHPRTPPDRKDRVPSPTRLIGLAALAAALTSTSTAAASTISGDGSTVVYTAAPGESNHVLVSEVAYDTSCGAVGAPCLSVWDSGAHISSASGACRLFQVDPIAGDTATCPVPTSVRADLGDHDDAYWDWAGPSIVDAGAGNDNPIVGDGGDDTLRGGIGNDLLEGDEGDDLLDGGAGDDALDGVPGGYPDETTTHGADTYIGGGGLDSVTYEERSEDLTLSPDGVADDGAANEGDDIGTDITVVIGGHGADVMTGNARRNVFGGGDGDDVLTGAAGDDQLDGGSGADRLDGGDGADVLGGEDGDDLLVGGPDVDRFYGDDVSACLATSCPSGRDDIRARDGNREQINCGPGVDVLDVDPVDVLEDSVYLSDQCEGAEGTPAAGAAARVTLGKTRVDRRNRIHLRVTAPGAGTIRARAGARHIRVAHRSLRVRGARTARLTLQPSRAARRALARRARLRVTLRVAFRPRGGRAVSTASGTATLRRR
jgi:Ca2+-binding RTX toxin-like protein